MNVIVIVIVTQKETNGTKGVIESAVDMKGRPTEDGMQTDMTETVTEIAIVIAIVTGIVTGTGNEVVVTDPGRLTVAAMSLGIDAAIATNLFVALRPTPAEEVPVLTAVAVRAQIETAVMLRNRTPLPLSRRLRKLWG